MPNEPESTVLAEGSSFCFAFCLSLAKPLPAIVSRQIKTVNRNTDNFTDRSLSSYKKSRAKKRPCSKSSRQFQQAANLLSDRCHIFSRCINLKSSFPVMGVSGFIQL